MPVLGLVPVSARFGFSVGESMHRSGEHRYLYYDLSPWRSLNEPVRLTGKEPFSELKGSLLIYRLSGSHSIGNSDNVKTPEHPKIGSLDYIEEYKNDLRSVPSNYQVVVSLPPELFDELLHITRLGKLPAKVYVEASGKGFTHGFDPDGGDVDWDNKQFPRVPVNNISFELPLILSPKELQEMREGEPARVPEPPPTREQVEQLQARVAAIASRLEKIPSVILWATVALGVAVAIF